MEEVLLHAVSLDPIDQESEHRAFLDEEAARSLDRLLFGMSEASAEAIEKRVEAKAKQRKATLFKHKECARKLQLMAERNRSTNIAPVKPMTAVASSSVESVQTIDMPAGLYSSGLIDSSLRKVESDAASADDPELQAFFQELEDQNAGFDLVPPESEHCQTSGEELVGIPVKVATQANEFVLPAVLKGTMPASTASLSHFTSPSTSEIADTAPIRKLTCYSYPAINCAAEIYFNSLSNNELTDMLRELTKQKDPDGKPVSYLDIRHDICGINEAMNRRGIVPPAFRIWRALPPNFGGRKYSDEQTITMCDKQMIDLLWLYRTRRGERLGKSKGIYIELFASLDDLNMELAERYIVVKAIDKKVTGVLGLTPFEQMQMSMLKEKSVAEVWRNAYRIADSTIQTKLRQKVERNKAFAPRVTQYKNLWIVDKVAKSEPLEIRAKIFGWLMGEEPPDPVVLGKELQAMRRVTK